MRIVVLTLILFMAPPLTAMLPSPPIEKNLWHERRSFNDGTFFIFEKRIYTRSSSFFINPVTFEAILINSFYDEIILPNNSTPPNHENIIAEELKLEMESFSEFALFDKKGKRYSKRLNYRISLRSLKRKNSLILKGEPFL